LRELLDEKRGRWRPTLVYHYPDDLGLYAKGITIRFVRGYTTADYRSSLGEQMSVWAPVSSDEFASIRRAVVDSSRHLKRSPFYPGP
jgi:hypothetical protein